MKGLDSNVLLRYILEDDPVWSAPASHFVNVECTRDEPGFINHIVLAEIVWSLRSHPGFGKARIAKLIGEFIDSDNLVVEDEELVKTALSLYVEQSAGFTDCLIAVINQATRAAPTYSIDKAGVRSKVFVPIKKGIRQ